MKKTKSRNPLQDKVRGYAIIVIILLVVYSLLIIAMCAWALLTSLKTRGDYMMNPLGLPTEWKFDNYSNALKLLKVTVNVGGQKVSYNLLTMLINSLLYAVGCTFFATVVPMMVSYCVAKFNFRYNKFIMAAVVFAMTVPIVGSAPSQIKLMTAFGMYDTLWGMWLMKAHFLGMYFFIFYANFKLIPKAYAESVYIDGGNDFTAFFRVMLPLSGTTISVVSILLFIEFWNDYQTPMLYLPSMPTAALGLFNYTQTSGSNELSSVPMQLTGCLILLIPIFIVFMIFKEKMMGNLKMGGLKG